VCSIYIYIYIYICVYIYIYEGTIKFVDLSVLGLLAYGLWVQRRPFGAHRMDEGGEN
jgi:hypothetical protein